MLASGHQANFGTYEGDPDDLESWKRQRYEFLDQRDLLGCFGYVATDENDSQLDYIVSLGFIVNECPERGILDYEVSFMQDYVNNTEEVDD